MNTDLQRIHKIIQNSCRESGIIYTEQKRSPKGTEEIKMTQYIVINNETGYYEEFYNLAAAKKAMKENETRKRKRGASTISQQTAKNVFLWPQSSWVRKGLEVYFTFLIELFWSKERIMEVYLNSIEMGNGIYGAQATAKVKFGTTAAQLTRGQCALIAATLPNPIRFNSAKPSSYILKRQNQILRLMNLVPKFPSEEKAVEKKKSKNKKGK